MTMKSAAYVLAILLISHLVFDVYFYLFRFKDMQVVIEELKKENENLTKRLSVLRDSLKKGAQFKPALGHFDVLPSEVLDFDSSFVEVDSTGGIELSLDKIFGSDEACSLTENGRKILQSVWDGFKDMEFDSMLILMRGSRNKTESDRRVRCVLNVKQFFVSLGAPQDKVWAWLRNDVKDSVLVLRVIHK